MLSMNMAREALPFKSGTDALHLARRFETEAEPPNLYWIRLR